MTADLIRALERIRDEDTDDLNAEEFAAQELAAHRSQSPAEGDAATAELVRLANCCPELNLSNYGPDDVDELNAWAIEVAQEIDRFVASNVQPKGTEPVCHVCGVAPGQQHKSICSVSPGVYNPPAAQAPAPVAGPAITERGRHHVAGLRSIREHHELSGDELSALTVAIAVMGNPPAIPCNEELERVADGHQGHPADFAADVLQRWGGWQPGLLGYGGKLNATQAPAVGGADDMLEPLIYAAMMHNGAPKTVAEFERAAANVADMLARRSVNDVRDAARYRALRDWKFSFSPQIVDPTNSWLTYTPEGLDKVCDAMIDIGGPHGAPASHVPVQGSQP